MATGVQCYQPADAHGAGEREHANRLQGSLEKNMAENVPIQWKMEVYEGRISPRAGRTFLSLISQPKGIKGGIPAFLSCREHQSNCSRFSKIKVFSFPDFMNDR